MLTRACFQVLLGCELGTRYTARGHNLQFSHDITLSAKRKRGNGLRTSLGKHSPNPFVVPRFIGAGQRNLLIDRMNAVTTNGLGECVPRLRLVFVLPASSIGEN